MEILVATNNPGKLAEIRSSFHGLPLHVRALSEFPGTLTVEEVGTTYEENAVLKALGYAQQVRLTSLADDSGLELDALGGAPGVLSARFGGDNCSDEELTAKLLLALSECEPTARTARFVCTLALVAWDGRASLVRVFRGECEGRITMQPKGRNGFGYDPVFVPNGYDQTFGELSSSIKDSISHRAKALAQMRSFLEEIKGELDRFHIRP